MTKPSFLDHDQTFWEGFATFIANDLIFRFLTLDNSMDIPNINQVNMQMEMEELPEANFIQVYMALTLSIVIVHCGIIDELRGGNGTWKGSFRYLATVVNQFIANDDNVDRLVDADILGHAFNVFKKRLTPPLHKNGYAIVQIRDNHSFFSFPAIPSYGLSSIVRGHRIELPMVITGKIDGKLAVDNAIACVSADLLSSVKLHSNIHSLSKLFLQLSQRFLDPRQARQQIEGHFRLV